MNEEIFLQYVSRIAVMKPSTIDDTNPNHLKKLQDAINSNDYIAEEKIDGCHYLCIGCRMFSTENIEKTDNYPHLRDFFISLAMPNLIVDGEVNYPGKTSQYCTRVTGSGPDVATAFQNDNGPIHYTIWDMLRTPKGTWLTNEPFWKRRKILEEFYTRFIEGTNIAKYIHLSDLRTTDKQAYFDDLIASGKEGIVLKRQDSIYVMGKKPAWQWIKLKQKDEADLFITGFEAAKIKYTGTQIETWPFWKDIDGALTPVTKYHYNNWFGAIILSAYINGKVTPVCTCSSGIDESQRDTISANQEAYIGKVVKITYMEKTEAGIPRHPRFESFHESKRPEECIWQFNE